MKQTKNLFNKLRLLISNHKTRKQLECKKNTFCDCTQDLSDLCVDCFDKKRIDKVVCTEPSCWLTVASTFPDVDATWVSITANPTVVFSKTINEELWNLIEVLNWRDVVDGSWSIVDWTTFVFNPTEDLVCGTLYQVNYTWYLTDECFVSWTFTFTTEECCNMSVVSTTPVDGSIVSYIKPTISVEFSNTLNQSLGNVLEIRYADWNPTWITFTISYPSANVMSWVSNQELKPGVSYEVRYTGYNTDSCFVTWAFQLSCAE